MIIAFITITITGLFLFLASFFMNDRLKQLEDEVEQISITSLQESYKLKRKVNILEEELLISLPAKENEPLKENPLQSDNTKNGLADHPPLKNLNQLSSARRKA
ncbi:hypothetical protein GCM10007216_23120 [Thalassobacillus devorans]|uniref:Uncharacterized protein n=1 Tax=Thalassobacillus devorans TaxID=279813 RepID=A0ABQ1P6T9_9BACI|nr:hypothetical protein [Thalassobacillus devorans]NIK29653.1 hypothetical protein [Thalassobacillus devorans]GGC91783.1 hypothetical protein GCM10007216_23120 [Thalassobacillus devorans]